MGSICSKNKRKGSGDATSQKSEASNKKSSIEGVENHSGSSKRRPSQNGKGQGTVEGSTSTTGPTASTATAADTPEMSLQKKDSLRSRLIREAEPSSVSGDSMSLSSPTTVIPPHGSGGGGGDMTFPLEMNKQNENVKHLLTGRVQRVKPVTKCRKITLYICASDSQDFRLEKGNLHTEVYPALREYCMSRGYELHITDLHWKTDLENKQDHDFPELCLGELKRQQEVSYIVPVLFLSNSLGAPLLPKNVEQQDFEMALKNVGDSESKALVEKWYGLDAQALPPCYRLKPISTHIPQIQSKNEEEKAGAIIEWRAIVEEILSIMLRVFSNELRDTYLTTVIEQEIHNSIFMSREVGKRSIWACRVFSHFQAVAADTLTTPIDMEKTRRLEALHNELKNQLVGSHILRLLVKWAEGGLDKSHAEHSQYLLELSTQLSAQLRSILDEIIDEDRTKAVWKSCYGVEGSLCSEVMQHTMFCQQAAKCSLSVETLLSDIKSYIGNPTTSSPLVLHGAKGCGKTSFLSRVIQQASAWFPDTFLIFRFVALTPESRSLLQLLRTVTSQFDFLSNGKNYWIPHNLDCYLKELYRTLAAPTPVLIIIDGIDKLNCSETADLSWLAKKLPAKMKLIISCEDGSPVFQNVRTHILAEDAFLLMSPLSLVGAESMLSASILQYSHSVDSDVQQKLCAQLQHCTHPLYIKVLSWRASVDGHGLFEVSQLTDVVSAINALFDYLEGSLGKEKVETTLALMCASEFGLCDSEILDLLAHSPSFCSTVTFVDWAPASLFLAQLFQRLGPFLEWGLSGDAVVIGWRDMALFEIAKKRYLTVKEQKKIRQLLLSYFQDEFKDKKNGRSVSPAPGTGKRYTRRRLEEVPYQQFYITGSIRTKYLCNLAWLLQKIQISSVYYVLEDISLEQSTNAENADLMLLRQTLELSASALSYDGTQFYGQMYGRLLPYFQGEGSSEWKKKCPFLNSLFEAAQTPKTPSFIPISDFLHSASPIAEDFAELANVDTYFSEMVRIKPRNRFVVSLSTAKEEVKVWDVYTEKPVRTLQGILNPSSLTAIDDQRCVILSGRELHVYNLDDGTFLSKLKGVMNQKMPYYGMHDSNHIVSLSRNRMYVNLMKVDTGDMVTTFKVGEDRFLNSLIVSENGKFLVCGDETQKPFPLLVWDLPSRKLLYDLRIPHHEFVTSLSAITKDGNFVCCICREVDDPGPNFIVVYDLQSGTLFKKWKPGFNTQAIAISAQGGCVINAIEDNRVLVWDLVTGACQWSMEKHIAPVDILRLDEKGARCLSCDSTGRDRSVCLWDLSNGTLLALFTLDVPFTACEVFNKGDGVALGLLGKNEIVTLIYRDNASIHSNRDEETFGSEEHHNKVTLLKTP